MEDNVYQLRELAWAKPMDDEEDTYEKVWGEQRWEKPADMWSNHNLGITYQS